MQITAQQRDEKFDHANLAQRYFYSDVESGKKLRAIFSKYRLNENLYTSYALTVGDVILGFYSLEELPNRLKGALTLDDTTTANLNADLQQFLAPLKDGPVAVHTPETGTTSTPQADISTEIADTEAALQTLPPIRTMARDMHDLESQAPQEEPAHRSNQEHLLERTANPAAGQTRPRWESEQ